MRILVAEPSRIGRTILARLLEDGGHYSLTAETAEEALAMLEADPSIDMLLTSIEFIGMSGFELCWAARLIAGKARPLFIVVMSASSDEKKLEEALDSGADDFISKPPRKTELLARLRSGSRMLEVQRELFRLASFDSLTGLWNRRAFFEQIEEEAAQARQASVLILDVDHFKQVNDRFGHDGGDLVLAEVARRLKASHGQFARIGGEEFALLMPGSLEEAGKLAELIRRDIAAEPILLPEQPLAVTVSIGVATRAPGASFDETIKDADIALYASKTGGRNRVTLARTAGNAAVLEDAA